MSAKVTDQKDGTVQTTNATATTAVTYTVPANSIAIVYAYVMALNAAAGDSKGFTPWASVLREGGAPAVVGSVVNMITPQGSAGATTWTSTIAISGNDVIVQVDGAIAATIEWRVRLVVEYYTP